MHPMSLSDRYEVVIVGGRVAGAATAIRLAREGRTVLLLERQTMPSDTLSTHILWPDGIAALDRLGVLEQVLATGAPKVHHFRLSQGEDSVVTPLIPLHGCDYLLCVRRIHLDGILWDVAAGTTGVTACSRTTVTGLVKHDGRVTGVKLGGHDGDRIVKADLVIGADGRDSVVARDVGAVEDDVVPAGLYWYYSYFANATLPEPPEFLQSASESDMVGAMPTNDGLLMVIYGAPVEGFDEFRQDHRANFVAGVSGHPWVARMLDAARLAEPVYGISGVRGYYRSAHGPGWVLVGDALHQKDPIVARGISDALREAEWLAEALRDGIDDVRLDAYANKVHDRTRSNALSARMQARPDRYMTEAQAARLAEELTTPEGLAGFVLLEYSDTITLEAYFSDTVTTRTPVGD